MFRLVTNYVDVPAYIIATVIGLILCFWGVQLSRFVSALAFSAFLGYITYTYIYSLFHSVALSILFMLMAIVIGFVAGFVLFRIALSIVFGYMIASILAKGIFLMSLLTVVFAMLIYVLSGYLLAILFVVTGSSLIYRSLIVLGLQPPIALIIILLVSVIGLYNQLKKRV